MPKKLTTEQVYQIMLTYARTNNYTRTADQLGMPESTVRKIVKNNRDKDEFKVLIDKERENCVEDAKRVAGKALSKVEQYIDSGKDIPVNHLMTVYGVCTEKSLLLEGKATENVSVDIILPPGADKYAG